MTDRVFLAIRLKRECHKTTHSLKDQLDLMMTKDNLNVDCVDLVKP